MIKSKYKYLLMGALVLAGFSSCSLEEHPKYTTTNNVVFSTESNAELALLGCYAYMSANWGYGQMWQEVPVVASGLTWAQLSGGDNTLAQLQTVPTNGIVSNAWKGMYKAINEANAFIASMEASSLSQDVKTQKIGEAKFLRALAYYNLASTFGDVPLKLVASSSDGISSPRTPVEQVYNQIIQDFTDATSISETSDDGRANAWAAKAYLGKVYYKMAMLGINTSENLQKAKTYFDEVYNSGVYSLESDYAGLFGKYVTGSSESIFQINFATSTSRDTYNRASNRFAPASSTSGVSWGTYRVMQYAYDLQQGTYPNDPRLEVNYLSKWRSRQGNNKANPKTPVNPDGTLCANDSSYAYPYQTYGSNTEKVPGTNTKLSVVVKIPYDELSNPKNPSVSELQAYTNSEKDFQYVNTVRNMPKNFSTVGNNGKWCYYGKMYSQEQVGTSSPKNLMVYRYAEMLLLMADTYNELGNTSKAIELANLVVARARNAGTNATYPQNWSSSLTQDEVREKLYFERIFELSGEPDIYDMVRIRGTEYLKKLLTYNVNHEITILGAENYNASPANNFGNYVFNDGNLTDEFLKKNLLLPIPSSEIDANPGIDTDDQNYGY